MSEAVRIGQLRPDADGISTLFEAIRVAQALGHDVEVHLVNDPLPLPGGEESKWEKEKREANSAVLDFWAEMGEK